MDSGPEYTDDWESEDAEILDEQGESDSFKSKIIDLLIKNVSRNDPLSKDEVQVCKLCLYHTIENHVQISVLEELQVQHL